MSPGNISCLCISGRSTSKHVDLIVKGSCTKSQFPVCRTCGHIKCCRDENHPCTVQCHCAGKLREADVVADHDTHFPKFSIKHGSMISRSQSIRFLEMLAIFYIDIKEMSFSVLTNLFSISVKNIRSVVNLSHIICFRHGTCDQINMILSGIIRHCLPGWTTFFFCINWKIFGLIRTAEHLRKNYKVRIFRLYFFYISAGSTDILYFIFYCGHLNCCYFHMRPLLSFIYYSRKKSHRQSYIRVASNIFICYIKNKPKHICFYQR